ncbi:helix-turn-helix domain-containing protein [Spartinivicinus ruber]|uniref:helix-turn-helix domain-containing protein n=1 Tax=Spartinivicinus ruber TaxID=2683272 RepID=UPI0013D8925B|nr:helix-turn-helix domain-containing protein [Spartinivicinus ruber]
MSIQAMSWVFTLSKLEPYKKIVLLSLADNANDQGYCWPSMDTIAHKSSMSKQTVRRHLKSLEELNLITKQQRTRANGATSTNGFFLHVGAAIKEPLTEELQENEGVKSDTPITEGVSKLCKGEGITAVVPLESSLESSNTTITTAREVKNSDPDIFQKKYETRVKTQGNPMTADWQPDWEWVKSSLIRAGINPDFANVKFDEFKLYWLRQPETLHPAWTAKFIQHLINQWPYYQSQRKRQQQLNQALEKKTQQQVENIEQETKNLASKSTKKSVDLDDETWADNMEVFK